MSFLKKGNIVTALATFALASSVQAATLQPVQADSLKWTDVTTLPPGAQKAIVTGDPTKHEFFIARIKFPANYSIPAHMHPINEYDTVISGTMYFGTGKDENQANGVAVPAGSFITVPAKQYHYAWTKEETVVQISGVGPWGMIYANQKKKG